MDLRGLAHPSPMAGEVLLRNDLHRISSLPELHTGRTD